ncbi:MAG: AroM family protein [Bacillota bacterium]
MNRVQFTLTVEEGKQLIARGVAQHPLLKNALINGKVVLKGGTTVSKIAEILIGRPLRISGRITERGTVAGLIDTSDPHSVLIEKGDWRNIDDTIVEEVQQLGPRDVIVSGANAIDGNKKAALMAGSAGGGNVGKSLSSWYCEGAHVLIPVGLEKLVPGNLEEIIKETGRKGKELSWGMSVGLMPIYGEVITEIEAVKHLAAVECHAIGAGGIGEAQGSVTLEAWGQEEEVLKLIQVISEIKEGVNEVSGTRQSLVQCQTPCQGCGRHIGCGYKLNMIKEKKRVKIGAITIGQSPRDDMVPDIERVLGQHIMIIQKGALDDFTYEQVVHSFSPKEGDEVLVTRMRDGRQVKIAEHHLLPLLQNAIDQLERQGVEANLLLCTGRFPEFRHSNLLLKPQDLLHSVTAQVAAGQPVGLLIPDEDQREQIAAWWNRSGVKVEVEVASPYQDFRHIEDAAERLKTKAVSLIFMDCMGYTVKMKNRVKEITGKPVMLPRTLAARVVAELFNPVTA